MATRPKIPNANVPFLTADGRVAPEWYRAISQFAHSGEVVTTVGAAGAASALPATPTGYLTVVVNGEVRQFPFYVPA